MKWCSKRRRWFLILALLVLAIQQTWRHGRDYVFADQLAAVEPGKVYRGAWQKDWPMRRIVRSHGIRTILALAHPPDSPLVLQERTLADELGVRWIHVPIADKRIPSDPSLSDLLEKAAAIIADPANQPVYFHCHHGINRASMAQMAYRMLYSGWTLEQAEDEIARSFGLYEANHGPDYRHMRAFYEERVLPKRQKPQQAIAKKSPASDTASLK